VFGFTDVIFRFGRDYAFFFSYMQPEQKGNILGMWSNADALAEVNCKLTLGAFRSPRKLFH
jgi:hypothetical protein